MNGQQADANLAAVRRLLLDGITDGAELRRFCQDRPLFRPIVDRFGPNHGFDDMVDETVDYCRTRHLVPKLLAALKDHNPRAFARHEGQLLVSEQGDIGVRSGRAPFQAPRILPDFVGREDQIERLVKLVLPGARAAITGITGMGGLGKTDLVRVVAARIAGRFADGVLWADCGKQDLPAIADLWAGAWGVQLAGDDEAGKAAAWRALVGGREALLVFDDVQPGQVVEPLFPAAGRSAVLITTRDAHHPALRGAEPLALEQFTGREAMDLARTVLGREWAEAQVGEAERFFGLVGHLPLAVSVGLHLARECDWRLATLNERLEAKEALAVLGDENRLRKSLNATFEAAWASLGEVLQATLATLALFNEAPSFDTAAAAAVLGVDEAEAGARLARLAGRSLLTRAGEGQVLVATEGRWALHALLRAFAAGKPLPDEAARARMAEHYAGVLGVADDLYLQGGEGVLRGLGIFDLEWPHIRAGQAWAAAHWQESDRAARLCSDYPDAGVFCLDLRLGARDLVKWLEAAAGAARRLADRWGEGNHLSNLGLAYADLGEARRAVGYHEQALAIAREICAASTEGSPEWTAGRRGEGVDLGSLGNAYRNLGEARRAIGYYERALAISREIGDRYNEGVWLGSLGNAHCVLGEARRAVEYYEQALAIAREIGNRRGEGVELGNLGSAYFALGEARRAVEYHEQALAISREIGDRAGEGRHSWNRGLLLEESDPERAAELMAVFVAYETEIGHPDAEADARRVAEIRARAGKGGGG